MTRGLLARCWLRGSARLRVGLHVEPTALASLIVGGDNERRCLVIRSALMGCTQYSPRSLSLHQSINQSINQPTGHFLR